MVQNGRPSGRATAADGRRKSTLVCPVCGHESPTDGDWIAHERGAGERRRERLTCPECGTVIADRPRFAGLEDGSETPSPVC